MVGSCCCALQVSSTESKLATLYEYVDDTEVRGVLTSRAARQQFVTCCCLFDAVTCTPSLACDEPSFNVQDYIDIEQVCTGIVHSLSLSGRVDCTRVMIQFPQHTPSVMP
jgi:hypothetical protein